MLQFNCSFCLHFLGGPLSPTRRGFLAPGTGDRCLFADPLLKVQSFSGLNGHPTTKPSKKPKLKGIVYK